MKSGFLLSYYYWYVFGFCELMLIVIGWLVGCEARNQVTRNSGISVTGTFLFFFRSVTKLCPCRIFSLSIIHPVSIILSNVRIIFQIRERNEE